MSVTISAPVRRAGVLAFVLSLCAIETAGAQISGLRNQRKTPRATRSSAGRNEITSLSFVLLVGRQGVGLRAQQWGRVFEKLNISVRIRRGTPADKIDTKETKTGRFRRVTVTGKLDRNGRLVFNDRSFTLKETDKLKDWVSELKAYGAQGAPDGKPLWGLSKAQFGEVYTGLSKVVETKVRGQALKTAVGAMKGPAKFPVRFSAAAENWLKNRFTTQPKVRHRVEGHSFGTALAMVLYDFRLGFRPLRTPRGGIELVVDPMATTPDVWPVGWEPKTLRSKIAPKLYKMVPVELKDVQLTDVLHAVSARTGVPVHLDYYGIAAAGIDVDKLKVSYARRKASWSVLVRGVTVPHKLTRKFRIDEQGRPFLWIQPIVSTRRTR